MNKKPNPGEYAAGSTPQSPLRDIGREDDDFTDEEWLEIGRKCDEYLKSRGISTELDAKAA